MRSARAGLTALLMLLGTWSLVARLAAQEPPFSGETNRGATVIPGNSKDGGQGSRLTTPGGRIFHRTDHRVANLRTVPVPGSSIELYLWEEDIPPVGIRPYYAVSYDGIALAGRVRQSAYTVELEGLGVDPLREEPLPDAGLRAGPDNTLHLVQFFTPPLPEFRAAVVAAGGQIHRFMVHHTFLVEMSPHSLAMVSALPYVRWVGPYHPSYRLEERLRDAIMGAAPRLEYQRFSIMLCERGASRQEAVSALVQSLGGEVHLTSPQGFRMEASLSQEQLAELIHANEIHYVDRWGGPGEPDMDVVRRVGGADFIETLMAATGEGVRGEVFDTEIRVDHREWLHPPMIHLPSATTGRRHGTSVYSNVFAAGVEGGARGMLPHAQGIFFRHSDSSQFGGPVSRYGINEELLDPDGPYQAVFQTSSVGSKLTTRYTTISAEMDDILFLHQIVTTQSQSNQGNRSSRPQAWAKNIVSCGAVWHRNTAQVSDDFWRSGASIGPAADGRVKPDLVLFFDSIYSASDESDSSYLNFDGTSSSTPQIAGHFGLLHQLWHEGTWFDFGHDASVFASRPKMATAKALMIHHATRYDWTEGCANCDVDRFKQGWGRPDLRRLVETAAETFIVDESYVIAPFKTKTYGILVAPNDEELKATLVYTDPMGTCGATVARVNDLSLRVTSPTGVVFWGNNGLTQGNISIPGGLSNTVDTVENVFVQDPEPGEWIVDVIADEVVEDSHLETPKLDADFALVISSTASVEKCLFSADFDSSSEGFVFIDDAFRGTSNPAYASGMHAGGGREGEGGALTVTLGGDDKGTVIGMSGGWRKSCSLAVSEDVTLAFDITLTQTRQYDSDEFSEALVSVDGTELVVLPRITGDGPGGPQQTESATVEVDLELAAGAHEIILGCFNNKRTSKNEKTTCEIDSVSISRRTSDVSDDDFDVDTDGFVFMGDPERYTMDHHNLNGGLSICGSACNFGGALEVTVGGNDDEEILDMIGKWWTTFAAGAETVTVTLDANLTLAANYGPDEFGEARLVVDDHTVVLSRLTGGNGNRQTTGFLPFSEAFNLETRARHTLDLECFNNKKDSILEETICAFDNVRVAATVPCPVATDFENGPQGWANDPASTCTTGSFIVGTPTEVVNGSVTTQVDGDHGTGKGNAFFTAFNTEPDTVDVDGGNCIAVSPIYSVAEASEVSIMYFHGQRDAGDDADDGFRLEMSTDGGDNFSTLASVSDVTSEAEWTEASVAVLEGWDVQFRVQVSDGPGSGDLIEAGIDDVKICAAGAADTAPQVSITSPADCAIFTAGQPITFAATAADLEDGDLTAGLSWASSLDGSIGLGAGFTISTLLRGDHTVNASVTDSGGLQGLDSITVTVIAPNAAPSVLITSPADESVFTAGDSVSFAGIATDAEDGDLTASLSWASSLDGTIGSGGSIAVSTLSPGTHVITASVTDSGGQTATESITLKVNPA